MRAQLESAELAEGTLVHMSRTQACVCTCVCGKEAELLDVQVKASKSTGESWEYVHFQVAAAVGVCVSVCEGKCVSMRVCQCVHKCVSM